MTLKSPIFRKLLATTLLVIATTLLVLDFYLTRYTTRQQVASVRERLEAEERILAGELSGTAPEGLKPWSKEAGSRAQARITVISPEGAVLADSEHDPETMENQANWPEIREVVRQQFSSSIRRSAALNRDICYLAMRVNYRGRAGSVLRLAVPLADADAAISAVRWRLLGASLVALLVALVPAYAFSGSLTKRIERLRRFADGLGDAHFSPGAISAEQDELGELARSLNRMSGQLRELVDRLSLESARRDAILASMVEGVLAVDGELRVIFCNESFGRAVGIRVPLEERVPLVDLVRDPVLGEMLRRVLISGESMRERLELPAGEGRVLEVQAAPLSSGPSRGAIAILHDITHLERLERIRKDFVANVSHELRTPLTSIRGYAETLLEGALDDKENNRRFLEIIKAHAVRLNNIASDLLTLSELESGKPGPARERFSIREALDAALSTVDSAARIRHVKLICGQVEDGELASDRMRFEQAIVNLLDNAVKFNRPGGEVRLESARTSDGNIRITISDTGIGIPSEHLTRIFERFYRVDRARSREAGGTGLGLSIVKHVVERMDGTIAVESQLGKGSKFTVAFPLPK